jgi:hypothetical protein
VTGSLYSRGLTFTVALMIYDYSRFLLHGGSFSNTKKFANPLIQTGLKSKCSVQCNTPRCPHNKPHDDLLRSFRQTWQKSSRLKNYFAPTNQPCESPVYIKQIGYLSCASGLLPSRHSTFPPNVWIVYVRSIAVCKCYRRMIERARIELAPVGSWGPCLTTWLSFRNSTSVEIPPQSPPFFVWLCIF